MKSVFSGCKKFLKEFLDSPREGIHYAYKIADTDLYIICNGYLAIVTKEVPEGFRTDYHSDKSLMAFGQKLLDILDNKTGFEIELPVPEAFEKPKDYRTTIDIGKHRFNAFYLYHVMRIVEPTRIIAEKEYNLYPVHFYNEDGREALLLPIRY